MDRPCVYDWDRKIGSCWCSCKSFFKQLLFLGCTGSFLFGINLSLLNTCLNYISWELHWCDFTDNVTPINDCRANTNFAAFLSTSVFIGAAIGSMTGGSFLSFGRRGMMLLADIVFIFSIICQVTSNSFSALVWARLCCGYAVGLISFVCPVYLSEITPADVRGKYGVFHQLFITIGILIGTLIGLPLTFASEIPSPTPGEITPEIDTFAMVWWRVMLGLAIIPVGISTYLLASVYNFETPHYYLEKGLVRDAEQIVKRLLNKDDVKEELRAIQHDIAESQKAKANGMSLGVAWKDAELRWVIIFGCILSAFQQFSGINVFIASSNKLFQSAGLTGYMPTIMTNIMNLINTLMTLPAVPLIEKLGRKTLLLIGCIGMTVAVLPAAICYWAIPDSDATMWLAIVGCLLFIIFFAATYGPILWVYLFEMYPLEIRGVAAGLATGCNWVAGIIMVFVVNYMDNQVSYTIFTSKIRNVASQLGWPRYASWVDV